MPTTRFEKEVINTPLFIPLRKSVGGDRAFAEFIKSKVQVLNGDILDEDLGLGVEQVYADSFVSTCSFAVAHPLVR